MNDYRVRRHQGEAILKLDFDTVIPGHGPLLTKEHVRSDRDKLVTMNQRMMELARRDVPLERVFDELKLAVSDGTTPSAPWHSGAV